MDIKWKKWTARRPVKIICVALIPILAFTFLMGGLRIESIQENISEDLLFADFRSNEPFFQRIALAAYLDLQVVFTYQSEESIRNGDFIIWQPVTRYYWDNTAQQAPEESNIQDQADYFSNIAEQFPELLFVLVKWEKGDWRYKRYRDGKDYNKENANA